MKHSVTIGNLVLPVVIRRHRTSRRITLRYQPVARVIALNLPRYVSIRQGLSFVEERRGWIAARLREHQDHTPFADGNSIPILGREHVLKHAGGRGLVRIANDDDSMEFSPRLRGESEGGDNSDETHPHPAASKLCFAEQDFATLPRKRERGYIFVPGDVQFMPRRVRDFLKQLAMAEIHKAVAAKAPLLGKSPRRICLRDTTSRWGSCSSRGTLSFSWRIVMAPREVLEYMVCHEMAHLKHMNHSQRFWDTVEMLCPHYRAAEEWLSKNGAKLYMYG